MFDFLQSGEEQLPATLLAWLLTYLIHSSLLLGGLWLLTRFWTGASDVMREALWKFGLVGGLASATIQLGFGLEPFDANLALDGSTATMEQSQTEGRAAAEDLPAALPRPARSFSRLQGSNDFLPVIPNEGDIATEPQAPRNSVAPGTSSSEIPWEWILGSLGALLLMTPAVLAWKRVRACLANRHEVDDEALIGRLRILEKRAGLSRPVRLTCSENLAAPIAIGTWRKEICLPPRAIEQLSPAQQESMLAHELAHLLRGDPAWLGFCRLLESVFFFQPLNRLARRRLQEIAEYRCDAWAAVQTGNSLNLARCLAEVAGWLVPGGNLPNLKGVSAMAASPSQLSRRIRRLLEESRPAKESGRSSAMLAAALLVPLTLMVPGVSARSTAVQLPLNESARPGDGGSRPAAPNLMLQRAVEDLESELAALDGEIKVLRESLVGLNASPNLLDLIEQLETQAQALRERRAGFSRH